MNARADEGGAEPDASLDPRGARALALAGVFLASVGVVWAFFAVPYLPTNDGPEHVFSGYLQNHFADPGTAYAAYLVPALQFAERGFATLFVPLEGLVGYRDALRASLTIAALATAFGVLRLAHALDPRRHAAGLLGFALAFPWPLYMGFFAFVIGNAVGLHTLASVLKRPQLGARARAAVALALFVQAVLHVVSSAFTGAVVAAVLLARAPRGDRLRELAHVALIGLPAASVLAATLLDHRGQATATELESFYFAPMRTWLAELPRLAFPGPSWRALMLTGIVVAGIGCAVARMRRGAASRDEATLTIVAIVLVVLACVAPMDIPGWQFFAPRFFPLGCALAIALFPTEVLAAPRARLAVTGVALVVVGASIAGSVGLHRRLARGCTDSLSGLDADLHFEGFRLPIALEPYCGVDADPATSEVPELAANLHLGSLFATAHGGLVPRMFVGPSSICAFSAREPPLAPRPPVFPSAIFSRVVNEPRFRSDASMHARVLAQFEAFGRPFEGVVVFGARDDEAASFGRRGYETELRSGSLLVARFVGCPLEIAIPRREGDAYPRAVVEYGLTPMREPTWRTTIDLARGDASEAAVSRVAVPRAACGDVWARVTFAGAAHDEPSPCANADSEGRIHAFLAARDAGRISCAR